MAACEQVNESRDLPKCIERCIERLRQGNLLVDVAGCAITSRQHGFRVRVECNDRNAIRGSKLLTHVEKTILGNVEFGTAVGVVGETGTHAARKMTPMQHWRGNVRAKATQKNCDTQKCSRNRRYLPLMSSTKDTSMGRRSERCSVPSNLEQKSTRMNTSSLEERCGRLTRATETLGSKISETVGRWNWNSLNVFSLLTNTACYRVRFASQDDSLLPLSHLPPVT